MPPPRPHPLSAVQGGGALQECQAATVVGGLNKVPSTMSEVCPHHATLAVKGTDAGSASKQERRGKGLTNHALDT